MPYESVSLISPLDDCEGGLGGGSIGIGGPGGPGEPIYPSAEFNPAGCCFTADFNLGCQEYVEHCGVWAQQDLGFAYQVEYSRPTISYHGEPGDHDCSCVLIQTENVTFSRTDKIYWVARYKLKTIRIHVGKVLVRCDGDEAPACKYYVAASYVFEVCDYPLLWDAGVTLFPEYTIDTTCTGNYRPGNCSYTGTSQEASTINNCQDVLNADPWQFCSETEIKIISRIKLYDALPSGQITITSADLPPVSCCGSETGCIVSGQPCGLQLIDNCVPNLPTYNGPPASDHYFCQQPTGGLPGPPPYAESCEIVVGCPEVEAKQLAEGTCEGYVFDADSGCYAFDGSVLDSWPGLDRFYCGHCETDEGIVKYYTDMYGTFGACAFTGLCLTGECCFTPDNPDAQFSCQEFYGDQFGSPYCSVTISDYTCTIGELQTNTVGAFCFNLPSVTIELS
jgi:hypothetical protein